MKNEKAKVKIIPLGGVNEIGKNLTAIEYKNDIVIIDCGLRSRWRYVWYWFGYSRYNVSY